MCNQQSVCVSFNYYHVHIFYWKQAYNTVLAVSYTELSIPVIYIYVKNIASMAITSHKDCGLDYSPMSQMVRFNTKNRFSKIDW